MLPRRTLRPKILLLVLLVSLPVAMTAMRSVAQAQGYALSSGITGEVTCVEDGPYDCPTM